MHYFLFLLIMVAPFSAFGQCGQEYPSGFYHFSILVTPKGDTLNKVDSFGLYDGLHVFSMDKKSLFTDTISHLIGYFHHGRPVGDWRDHCKDGSYSIGSFSMGSGESIPNGKGVYVHKEQGLYVKIGTWKYFNKDGILQKTMYYDRQVNRKGWTNQTFLMDSTGLFILVKFKRKYRYGSRFSKEIDREYSDAGLPVSFSFFNFWKDIYHEYDDAGRLTQTAKRRKLLGKPLETYIEKEFNSEGRLERKTKTKVKIKRVMINQSW